MTDSTAPQIISIDHPRLDAALAPSLRQELLGQLGDRPQRVLLDLRRVDFIDSTGLGVLVSLLKQMGPEGRIAVLGASASARRLFQITRLDTLFLQCDTLDQAHAALG